MVNKIFHDKRQRKIYSGYFRNQQKKTRPYICKKNSMENKVCILVFISRLNDICATHFIHTSGTIAHALNHIC